MAREITLRDLLVIARKWLILLIIAPIVGGAATGFYFYRYVPNEYTARVVLYVLQEYTDTTTGKVTFDTNLSAAFAADYQILIETPGVINDACKRLGVKNFKDVDIKVTAASGTRVVYLDVVGKDPVYCTDVANTMANVFSSYIGTLASDNALKVASVAQVPQSPSGPARLRNTALGAIVALVFAMGVVMLIEMLNDSIRTSDDVTQILELTVLAEIEGYKTEMDEFRNAVKEKQKPLYRTVSSRTRETIKTLATNIQFCGIGDTLKTMVISSPMPNEGKSSIAVMLASALADEGMRVIIVDMDFRSPRIGKLLRKRNRYDLVDMLSGHKTLDEIVYFCEDTKVSFIDNMHKSAIATNIIKMDKFGAVVEELKKRYDCIIFDTPPVGLFIDAALLSASADATLMVVGSGVADRMLSQSVVEQFKKANANLIGVALNFIKHNAGTYYSYHHYRYYSKSYDDDAGIGRSRSEAKDSSGI